MVAKTSNLVDNAIQDQIQLERAKLGFSKTITPILNRLSRDVSAIIVDIEKPTKGNINKALKEIKALVHKAYGKIKLVSDREFKELIIGEIENTKRRGITETPAKQSQKQVKEDAEKMLGEELILGALLSDWLLSLELQLYVQIDRTVKQGFSDNLDSAIISRAVRGTSSRKFKDGVFNKRLHHLISILHTAIQAFAVAAKQYVWRGNKVKKYIWISVLDSRTTPICRDRDKNIYIVDEGPLPPAHPRCRSNVVPYYDGMEIPETYSSWLRKQPREFVEDTLGKEKANLFLSSDKDFKFTAPHGRELTIKELKNRRFSEA